MRIGPMGAPDLFFALALLLLMLLPLLLFWRVFEKAGLPPIAALLCLVPGVGFLLTLALLAFTRWPLESST